MVNAEMMTTARLVLRPLAAEDAPQIQRIFARWEIVRYLVASVPWPYPEGAARHYVEKVALPLAEEGKGWFWTLRRKENVGELIGMICLMDTPDNNRGFWLAPEWQGQGYMSEACEAVTDFWFYRLDREVLRAPKAALNERSNRLSVRQGMRLVRSDKSQYVAGLLDSQLWEITRDEWRRRHHAARS